MNAFSLGVEQILDNLHIEYIYLLNTCIFQVSVWCIVFKHVFAITKIEGKFYKWAFAVEFYCSLFSTIHVCAIPTLWMCTCATWIKRGEREWSEDTFSLSVVFDAVCMFQYHRKCELLFKAWIQTACVSGPGIDSEVDCVGVMLITTPIAACYSTCKQCCFITSNSCSFTCLRRWCKQYLVHVFKSAKIQLISLKSPASIC